MSEFHIKSYEKHKELYNEISKEESNITGTWFEVDTVDAWRHQRMYDFAKPLLEKFPKSKWITVGDGRYGLDSIRLKKMMPTIDMMPTDISPYLLEKSKEEGLIEKFKVENAEALTFKTDEFDFAFMKETYHHLPRPYAAIYEMLRVAKKAIIFIEPNDKLPLPFLKKINRFFINSLKKLMGKSTPHIDTWSYEEVGNYIYSISYREFEKVALGLNLPCVAYAEFNDHYIKGVEHEKVSDNGPLFKSLKRKISLQNLQSKLSLNNYTGAVGIIFKEMPDNNLIERLKNSGYKVNLLPRNPYAK